jgi:hydrogenase nickel incorporation protein HypA/HybF
LPRCQAPGKHAMHELSITQSVVEICAERAGGAAVKRVTLEVGELAAIMPEAIRFCFDVCAAGTVVEGAELEIVQIAGRGRCRACGLESAMSSYLARCACGTAGLECIRGDRLIVKTMEMS